MKQLTVDIAQSLNIECINHTETYIKFRTRNTFSLLRDTFTLNQHNIHIL